MLHLILCIISIVTSIIADSGDHDDNNNINDNPYYFCDYVFKNQDFYYGTYRIIKSGKYCLGENIVLNPRAGSVEYPNKYGSWFPINDQFYPGSVNHDDGGFALGFFAAISIEVSNVELDLMGFGIVQARPFYLQQRFFNLIEIQNAPFNWSRSC